MAYKLGICWLRRDLRLEDNRALAEACAQCESVAVVFVFDTSILKYLGVDDRRLTFIHESLAEIDGVLKKRGAHLIILNGDAADEIPRLTEQLKADVVFANHDYEASAKKRDEAVRDSLRKNKKEFYTFQDQTIFEKRDLLTGGGGAYKKFTPYKNNWLANVTPAHYADHKPNFKKIAKAADIPAVPNATLEHFSLKKLGFEKQQLWLKPGAEAARVRLAQFEEKISNYGIGRDFPAVEGTSGLSVHLRFGTISIRECVRRARDHKNPGGKTWLSELIWRDFYMMILDQYPHVQKSSFKEQYENLKWPGKEAHFQKWCEGNTGYPLVDAAMRHFNDTGWMHNRLRMVVAMFLTKDLLVDYKKGEAYFAKGLLDFDLSANNGGWQWSASTGVDSQPYFRIFNPISQSEKFDSDGDFIRLMIPELKNESKKTIHWPHDQAKKSTQISSYALPIVDHKTQRDLALDFFKKAK